MGVANDFRASLVSLIKNALKSKEFITEHRLFPEAFTRKPSLTFDRLFLLLCSLLNSSMKTEIGRFFGILDDGPLCDWAPDESTVFKARMKLCPSAFTAMNDKACEFFYQEAQPERWHGMRLLAVDGSTVRLPPWPDVLEEFPQDEDFVAGESTPLARISEVFDVLNDVSVSATISPMANGEQTLLLHHQDSIQAMDLVLGDRGYAAFWIFQWTRRKGAHFCIRMTASQWNCAIEFVASGQSEVVVELSPCSEARKRCAQLDLPKTPLSVRLIRVELSTGDVEVLCTSLLDCKAFPAEEFKKLYFLRWPVEEKFKRGKWRAEIENFSGKSGLSIVQDFHASIFSMNLAAMMAAPVKEVIAQRYEHCQYRQKVNWASGLSGFKQSLSKLFFGNVNQAIERLQQWFVDNVIPIRPDRKYQRKHKSNKRRFYITYKPCV